MTQRVVEPTIATPRGDAVSARRRNRLVAIMAVVILIPSMLGFANKFRELVNVLQGDVDGAFALAPIMNYILASLGFLMMLGWAAANGMFRDIEAPKQHMLSIEQALDARENVSTPSAPAR